MRRSRIHENFSEEDMEFIKSVCRSGRFESSNAKADVFLYKFRQKGFTELAPATNRYAMMKDGFVFKFALDTDGIRDNRNEFKLSMELQPYVTKTYECNGYVLVAEYINIMEKNIFRDSREHIASILETLSEDYIFADVGILEKNFCNWGFRDDNTLCILDYGYFKRKDPRMMYCRKCGGELLYDSYYDKLYCRQCTNKYNPIEIMSRMSLRQEDFDAIEKVDGIYFVDIMGED